MTTPSLDWLWWTGGGVLGVLGLVVGAWALFGDRSRRQRRCPKCWYDLSGTPGLVCSECGFRAKREKKLFKTRRRWRWGMVGLLALLGGACSSVTPQVQGNRWLSLVPTTVLVLYLPCAAADEDPFVQELYSRLPWRGFQGGPDPWWNWQWRLLATGCLDGDAGRKPASADWVFFYGYFLGASIDWGGILEDSRMRTRMASVLPVDTTIESLLAEGPENGMRCRLQVSPTWGWRIEYRITATPRLSGGRSLCTAWEGVAGCQGSYVVGGHDEQRIGTMPAGARAVIFDVVVECRRLGQDEPWKPYSSSVVTVPLAG